MTRQVALFAAATLAPLPLLVAASFWGGGYVLLALGYLTLFTFALDELAGYAADPELPEAEFPAANGLSVALALAHYVLIALAVYALSGGTGLDWHEATGLFIAYGIFFGQVSNSNAHELIHRPKKSLYRLGKWVYISLLFGHHTSAHRRVHHRYVATRSDPNSAKIGESFYAFAPRAWYGSLIEGYRAEKRLLKSARRSRWRHPYLEYFGGSAALMAAAAFVGGIDGLLAYVALCAYAQIQLLLSDYVQHYGLQRRIGPDGTPEPIGPSHSWNATHWFSNYLMLNAPRHSDHHAHPSKPFPALTLPHDDIAPVLPHSLPVMSTVALFPNLWRRMMDQRLHELHPERPVPAGLGVH